MRLSRNSSVEKSVSRTFFGLSMGRTPSSLAAVLAAVQSPAPAAPASFRKRLRFDFIVYPDLSRKGLKGRQQPNFAVRMGRFEPRQLVAGSDCTTAKRTDSTAGGLLGPPRFQVLDPFTIERPAPVDFHYRLISLLAGPAFMIALLPLACKYLTLRYQIVVKGISASCN